MVAFAGPFALYVGSLTPGVAFWDTGEMQTVPNLPGIAHPTGFPAFVLGGWAFAHAFPFGSPAWRISLFSVLSAAGAAALLARFVRELTGDALVATAAALAYAAGDIVWTRGARADVHDLALCCTAGAFVAAQRAAGRSATTGGATSGSPVAEQVERGRQRALVASALCCGTGLATHPVAAFALPSALTIGWPALLAASARQRAVIAVAALAPLALYLYVPLRSAYVEAHGLDPLFALSLRGGAFWNYDAPAGFGAFARYASGAAFAPDAAFAAALSSQGVVRALAALRGDALAEFGTVMLALVMTGFVSLARSERPVAVAFALLLVADATFAANYGAESDVARYGLAALWAAGVCAGRGAAWLLAAVVGERSRYASALAAALLLLALWPNVAGAARDVAHRRRSDDASRFAADIAWRTEDGSLVIATWTFAPPLAYDAYVLHGFGARRLLTGWPEQYQDRLGRWRARFGHVYVVCSSAYDPGRSFVRRFSTDRWQLAELRS